MKSSIVVEARKDSNVRHVLDAIAEVCSALGHDVCRWRGPLSGRVPYPRRLPAADLAIVFNGTHASYTRRLHHLVRKGTRLLFVELGWYPQEGTLQVDPRGINSAASWSPAPLRQRPATPLAVRSTGDLLVLLQHDADTQITHHSPWFADMADFVQHIGRYSEIAVRIRPHPRHAADRAIFETIDQLGLELDDSADLAAALEPCKAVACVNSSAAVEALAHGLPVLCYGKSIYRHRGAVYCLTDDPQRTVNATRALANNMSELFAESVAEVLARIRKHQWTVDDVPVRLPPLLDAALAPANDTHPPGSRAPRSLLDTLRVTVWPRRRAG